MTELLAQMGEVGTFVFDQAGNVIDFVVANPLCMIGPALFFIGGIVGMGARMLRVG